MLEIDAWLRELSEEPDQEAVSHEAYQKQLFCDYVLRNTDNWEKRMELKERFEAGEPLEGEKGLRKELAAFDLG